MKHPTSKYRAICQSVTPAEKRSDLERIDSCYLGVSLQTPAFEPPMLTATVDWIAMNFRECTVAIGDSIHRHTLQILRGISPAEALMEALDLGEMFIRQNSHLFARHESCKFEFRKFSEIQTTDEYKGYEHQITELFETDADFRASIENSARAFVSRRITRFDNVPVDEHKLIQLSCNYILEEIGCFTWLASNGRRVDVYPGSELPVLVDVARGKYAVPRPLRDRINVALKLKANQGT